MTSDEQHAMAVFLQSLAIAIWNFFEPVLCQNSALLK